MQRVSVTPLPRDAPLPPFTPGPVEEDITPLLDCEVDGSAAAQLKGHPDKRRHWMANEANRKRTRLDPEKVLKCDFSNGFINCECELRMPSRASERHTY
jgi:hypothetical protein